MGSSPGTNLAMTHHPVHPQQLDASSDADAEGEYDDEVSVHQSVIAGGRSGAATVEPEVDSDIDAEGSEDEVDLVSVAAVDFAVKVDGGEEDGQGEPDADAAPDAAVESVEEVETGEESADAASEGTSESEAENEWEGGSESAEEVEADVAERNNCV
jgi:histone acetyltransferase SAS3